ncbi:MAG: hypothetical protein COY68_02930 [Candidatus Levybacteria bacterium CG_4_10_14_0_8_um_filter_35_23]|nr:MAG: hypothetical protein COY68_02930 [Candidatus Levybacteria bacterium CG_4_10_14_0_8_um_filter_35_23]
MENINQESTEKVKVNTDPVFTKKTFFKPIYLFISAFLIITLLLIVWVIFQPESKTSEKTADNTKKMVSVEEAVEKAGYKVSWNGNKNDTTGRSIIADNSRDSTTTFQDSVAMANLEQNPQNIVFGLGVFKGWETIANSKDVYILLENPQTKKSYKGRITFDDSAFNFVDNRNVKTLFLVEDMNYGPTTKTGFDASGYYFLVFETNPKEDSQKAIKTGDVIGFRGLLEDTAKQIVKKDSSGVSVIHKVYLRRFGGSSELIKELK